MFIKIISTSNEWRIASCRAGNTASGNSVFEGPVEAWARLSSCRGYNASPLYCLCDVLWSLPAEELYDRTALTLRACRLDGVASSISDLPQLADRWGKIGSGPENGTWREIADDCRLLKRKSPNWLPKPSLAIGRRLTFIVHGQSEGCNASNVPCKFGGGQDLMVLCVLWHISAITSSAYSRKAELDDPYRS